MSKGRIITGIELGSSKITTLVSNVQSDLTALEPVNNIVGISSTESKGIRKGQIVNIEEAVEAVIASVEAAERMAGYNIDRAYVSLGGASVESQNSRGVVAVSNADGEITEADVDRVIEAASAISIPSSREVIHVIPREFTVDGEGGVKDPVGMSGVRLEVETHLITASTASIKNLKKAINEVGIEIEELVFSGIAASEACLSSTEKELGCVLVDIGGGTTSIAVYTEGSLVHSSVLPVGARNVTNDLAIGLRVSLESAEKIKLALSDSLKTTHREVESVDNLDLKTLGLSDIKNVSKKTLVEGIIRPRINEIFTMVRINLERAGLISRVPSGVVITGGGAETVGMLESAKRILTLPARRADPQGVSGLIDDIMCPAFAVPIGLVIYGSKQVPTDSGMSFPSKIKLPNVGGVAGKVLESIKNLLP